jgi:hypothetical protein
LFLGFLGDVVVVNDHDAVRRPDGLRDFGSVAVLVGRVVDQVNDSAAGRDFEQTRFLDRGRK